MQLFNVPVISFDTYNCSPNQGPSLYTLRRGGNHFKDTGLLSDKSKCVLYRNLGAHL